MSNIYNLEPPTKGKVILHTNLGDLEIELWPKEAPKACRNFVQLCAEGYYDGTIFHRVIKDYIAQAGDPTGTGNGGESIYGEAFKDEFHSRLRFTRRGLVACANQNEPNTNGSQFFFTLDKTDWLNNRNTIFGRIVGDTVYNMLRFNDLPVDENDRPMDPPVIREAEVVWNPFDDMEMRVDREAVKAEAEAVKMAAERARRASGRTKNLSLLSFGDEAEEEEAELQKAVTAEAARRSKIRSAHDVLDDERLAKEAALEQSELDRIAAERPAKRTKPSGGDVDAGRALARAKAAVGQAAGRAARNAAEAGEGGPDADEDAEDLAAKANSAAFAASMRAKMAAARTQAGDERKPRLQREEERAGPREPAEPSARRSGSAPGDNEEDEEDAERRASGRDAGPRDYAAERRAELDAMREDGTKKTYGRVKAGVEVVDADLLKPWQLSREKYKARKKAVGNREKDTLARLAKFQSALRTSEAPAPKPDKSTAQAGPSGREEPTAADAAAAAGPSAADGAAPGGKGYEGKVDARIDHRAYMPAAWRVDSYLDDYDDEAAAGGGDGGVAALRAHRFEAAKDRKDAMARDMDNLDDYVVYDPLLEKSKGKWSAAGQREAKRQNEWAGRANM